MHVVDAYGLYKHCLDKKLHPMSLMEFTEILAAQLLNNNERNVDINENDPDDYPNTAGRCTLLGV